MQGGKRPTAKEQKWQDWQRSRNCCNCGAPSSIHHCVGSTAKHNKIHIGQFFTIALCYDCHQGDSGIHKDRSAFHNKDWDRKEIEKDFFMNDVFDYRDEFGDSLVPEDVYNAIVDYHK